MKKILPIVASLSLLAWCSLTPTNNTKIIVNSWTQISISSVETISSLSNSTLSNSFSITLDWKEKTFDLTNTWTKIDFGKIIQIRDFPGENSYTWYEYTLLANLSSREKKLLSQEYNMMSWEKLIQPSDWSSPYYLIFSSNFENLNSPAEWRKVSWDNYASTTPVYVENFEWGIVEANLESWMCDVTTLNVMYEKENKIYNFRYNNVPCVWIENAKKIIEEIKSIIKTIK